MKWKERRIEDMPESCYCVVKFNEKVEAPEIGIRCGNVVTLSDRVVPIQAIVYWLELPPFRGHVCYPAFYIDMTWIDGEDVNRPEVE